MILFLVIVLYSVQSISNNSQKNKFISKVKVTSIKATSILEKYSHVRYYPHNLLNTSTLAYRMPWVEGKKGPGIGESVTLTFDKKILFNKLIFMNGFYHEKWFSLNNRIKTLKIYLENKMFTITLKDMMKAQFISLKNPAYTKKIKIEIASIYKGTKYQDTCLSLVRFFYNDNEVQITSIPKYGLCNIEEKISASWACPPGGQPEISLKTDGTIEFKSTKLLFDSSQGYNINRTNYTIDMYSLKKREFDGKGFLWSAKVYYKFKNGKKRVAYIIDPTGKINKYDWGQLGFCTLPTGYVLIINKKKYFQIP